MTRMYNRVIKQMDADKRFSVVKRTSGYNTWTIIWTTVSNIDLKKNLAGKGYGIVKVQIFEETKQGMEFKVDIFVPSWAEWNTFFEGFAERKSDFNRVMVMLGIN